MVNEKEFKKLLIENDTTISKLSDATGIKRAQIYSYLNGKVSPSGERILKMAKALKIENDAEMIKLIFLN